MAIVTNISVCGHAAFPLYMPEGHIKIKWTLLGLKKKMAAQYDHDCVLWIKEKMNDWKDEI